MTGDGSAPDSPDRGLAESLVCSQCGYVLTGPACGPTHALLAADPTQHRAVAPLVARAAEAEAAVARVEALADLIAGECWNRLPSGEPCNTCRLRAEQIRAAIARPEQDGGDRG